MTDQTEQITIGDLKQTALKYVVALKRYKNRDQELGRLQSEISDLIENYIQENHADLYQRREAAAEASARARDRVSELKDELKDRCRAFYFKTGNKNAFEGGGVEVREYKDKKGRLIVDEDDAITWAIENEYHEFLDLKRPEYKEQLERLRLKGMPGRVEYDDPDYRPFVFDDRLKDEFEGEIEQVTRGGDDQEKKTVDEILEAEPEEGDIPF